MINELEIIEKINKKFDIIYFNYIKIGLFDNYVDSVHINTLVLQTYGFQVLSIDETNIILKSLCDYLNKLKIVSAVFSEKKVSDKDYYYFVDVKRNTNLLFENVLPDINLN